MKYIIFAGHIGSSAKNIIIPLLEFFEKKNIKVIFLNANSLNGNIEIPQVEGLESFDIFLNDYKSLQGLLETKKPLAIFSLSFRSLFDIFINRLGHLYNIPTVYFEHGLFISGLGDKFVMSDYKSSIWRYLNYFKKYFVFIGAEKINPFKEFKNIYRCVKQNDYTQNQYDAYLFYATHGKDQVYAKFKFKEDEIYYSGYPLVKYKGDLNIVKAGKLSDNFVLYIHQPLVKDRLTEFTYEDEKKLIGNIVSQLAENNLKLIFKIHPREDIGAYKERFGDIDVIISADPFADLLPKCKLVIGQFSTALFFAAKYFIPLIIIPYKGVSDGYYTVFEQIGTKIGDAGQLGGITKNIGNLSDADNKRYTDFNNSIIGNNNSFEDQADTLINIIENLH